MLAGLLCRDNVHLVIGAGSLAATRCTQSLAAGARPVLIAPGCDDDLHHALRARIDEGAVRWENKAFTDDDLFTLGRPDVDGVVDAVFVTRGRNGRGPHTQEAARIAALCRRHRVPVNVVDAPALCTFTLLSVHADGPLQVGVSTSGNGCKLASRIRREVAASLPRGLGLACARLGEVRRRVYGLDDDDGGGGGGGGGDGGGGGQLDDSLGQRMRWLGQVCEYWPLKKLATIADDDVDRLLATCPGFTDADDDNDPTNPPRTGKLILAGSGPGHPSLLTRATLAAMQRADVVLADKLVPSAVLDLIPRRVPVHIARKFPGNADRAQDELLEAALAGVRAGRCVLRLKQGDPFLYGRGGEELAWFRERGLAHRVAVLPGVTSALSAPLFAGIPVTQRDVADQVLVCTGTGKKGKPPAPPAYVATRTVVFLMALHRITGLVAELTTHLDPETPDLVVPQDIAADKGRALWPPTTPCAVVERASCPDQRVIRTTLAHVAQAVDAEGSRPPGLLVVGAACEVLYSPPDRDAQDPRPPWIVEEGFRGLDDVDDMNASFGIDLDDKHHSPVPEAAVRVGEA
ncbi:tetrapyrrole (Corrin/Porphyrin) methylases domain-containing protein [Hirsutella rhossiliensis]|uniref:Tetrapyrrole (Corrin/Porphyrin) methylases domain-containing protein n=1 Tax=Hirsutella rhossiliensis TaxID=111463 RepID=A0A9P8MXH8_9HYPO|nr:tetrapyrrole (Corrin/Porphyrin) methylases domain-containing protein [Hirsutella rhossiliensis]KAH0963898.1 tetrapyrrole (Corrin/Porphyrin) methylases domain-containing protein [Hirsutella rhossiliensis]